MTRSKAWNWEIEHNSIWDTPTWEYYYLSARWKAAGYCNVLDMGCGKGRHAKAFQQDGFNVSACDLSEYAIDSLKGSVSGIRLDVCDIRSMPYSDSEFDALFSYHVISHTDSEGIYDIINEIRRVVRIGGEVFIDFISNDTPMFLSGRHPKIDENTYIMQDEGPEYGIPHYTTDYDNIVRLMDGFKLINVTKAATYNIEKSDVYGIHYYILARRI